MPTIKKTLRIFHFIRRMIEETGDCPTYKEIQREFGLRSPATIHEHVIKMEARGWITREKHCSRAIRIVERRRAA